MNAPTSREIERGSGCRNDAGATRSQRRLELLGFKLRAAAFEGDVEGLKKALGEGAEINSATQTGWTALDFSVRNCHDAVSIYLRRQGGRMGEQVWTGVGKTE